METVHYKVEKFTEITTRKQPAPLRKKKRVEEFKEIGEGA
jgi:hypothetical protein